MVSSLTGERMTTRRTIATGDIHGCSVAFDALIEAIAPHPDDTIIPLGDYVDRGIDSKCLLDQLIATPAGGETVSAGDFD